MTYLLLDDIRRQLAAAFSGLLLPQAPTRPGAKPIHRPPNVFVGNLPPKQSDKPVGNHGRPQPDDGAECDHFVPFAVVRFLDGQVSLEQPRTFTANIGVVFEVYVPGDSRENGVHDLLNVADRVVEAFCVQRLWGGDFWQHQLPIKMIQGSGRAESIYDSGLQGAGPFYGGAITTQFIRNASAQNVPRGITG